MIKKLEKRINFLEKRFFYLIKRLGNTMRIEINCFDDIQRASRSLHDGIFARKDFIYYKDRKIFILDAVRFMWERVERKGIWIFKIIKAPWIKCRLELKGVLEYKIKEYEKMYFYEFSSIEVDKNDKLFLSTAAGIEIEMVIEKIEGCLFDIGNLIENDVVGKTIRNITKHRFNQGLDINIHKLF